LSGVKRGGIVLRTCRYLVLVLLLAIFLTGCNDNIEVERITFPVALGIDWDTISRQIIVYAQISTLSSQSGGQTGIKKTYKVLEGKGKNLLQAMSIITDHVEEYVSWKQLTAVVVSSKIAEHGISYELDVLNRDFEVHMNAYLLVTNQDLKDLLEATPMIESVLATPLAGVALAKIDSTSTKAVTIREFIMNYLDEGIENVLPKISILREEAKEVEFDYTSLGVFKEDKLVGWLDEYETLGLLSVFGIKNKGNIDITDMENNQGEGLIVNKLTIETKIIPSMQQNTPGITLKMQAKYNIAQTSLPKEMDINEANKVNIQVQSYIKKEVEAVIMKAQKDLNADIFGFGERIYRKYPKYWIKNKQKWSEIFPHIHVNIEVDAQLANTGDIGDSLKYLHGKD
jgi:spore germination protein KC